MIPHELARSLELLDRFLTDAKYSAQLVVCGGAGLALLNFISRPTKDVDVLALLDDSGFLVNAKPLPEPVRLAAERVANALGLPNDWLNDGPALQIKFGFPVGIEQRLIPRRFGANLTVHFIGRLDQIHLKLFAAADQGAGRHVDDLLALRPTEEELETAARWVAKQDASEAFSGILRDMLRKLGYARIAGDI
jgi:hypothetical protein